MLWFKGTVLRQKNLQPLPPLYKGVETLSDNQYERRGSSIVA